MRRRSALGVIGAVLAACLWLAAPALADHPPANDDFPGQDLGSASPVTVQGTNVHATLEVGEPETSKHDGVSVWYSWTAPGDGPVVATTCSPETDFDTVLGVYTGDAVDGLAEVDSNDDDIVCPNDLLSRVRFDGDQGTTYRIAVAGYHDEPSNDPPTHEGSFELRIRQAADLGNDDFVDAFGLAGLQATVFGSNIGATKEIGEDDHADDEGGASVWFAWTAPASGPVTITTCSAWSDFDTLLAVYTGNAVDALTEVASNDDADPECFWGGLLSQLRFNGVQGRTYQIAVDGYNNGEDGAQEGLFELAVRQTVPAAPTIDRAGFVRCVRAANRAHRRRVKRANRTLSGRARGQAKRRSARRRSRAVRRCRTRFL